MPQGAGFSGDRGGQMKRGPRKTCFAGNSRRIGENGSGKEINRLPADRGRFCGNAGRHRAVSSAPTGAENGVHFPPAESGQKGRRGATAPRAKCPPEPPVRALRGRFLLHPSPASAAGLCFFLEEASPRLASLRGSQGAGTSLRAFLPRALFFLSFCRKPQNSTFFR